jgi:hypothetical protein
LPAPRLSPQRVLAIARADEEDKTALAGHLLDDLCGAAKVRSGGFEGDDVHALPDAVDVACIRGVPERRGVALVGFGCQEQLERDVGGRGGVAEQRVRLVVRRDVGTERAYLRLCSVSEGNRM